MKDEQGQQPKLKPTLGLFDATAISVGAIIGAGIFVVTGITAGYAGSALVVSMLVAALISLFTALSFAELTAWLPKEGSVHEFGYELISPFAGFLAGWMWMLSNTFTGAAVSLGFAYYFADLFPTLPPQLVAAVLCIAFTALNFFGIRQSALLNNFLVTAKLIILAFFCIFGMLHANTANFIPFMPLQAGVFVGAFYIFFAYGGFGRVAVVAEEVKDARRNVPRAIILSLVISTIFYIAVGAVAVALIGATQLSHSNSPLAEAISVAGSPIAVRIVSAGGLLATASVLLTSILGVSRMAYAMARRRDLPQRLSRLHLKYDTPYYAVWITGISMALLVLLTDLSNVVAVGTFAMLFYYASANVSALRLPKENRLYHNVVPVLGAITCLALLGLVLVISAKAWIIGLASLAAGTIYYFTKERVTPKNATLM
jgi:APA family basic amino acid/polyamine antiporter